MYTRLARIVSLLSASVLATLITVYPPAIGRLSHGVLTLVILGICAGFVHGVGFDPETRFWRVILGPVSAWVLMGLGFVLIAKPYFIGA
ncbi:MAG: cyd operon YbgE family protein [Sulfuriferula sp.]|nr:cyd operon YbgE family protein [Sulfuriferula sp.]